MTTLLSPARPGRAADLRRTDKDVFFVDASLDGSIAYLESEEQLTADDANLRKDGVRVHPPAPGTVVPAWPERPGFPAAAGRRRARRRGRRRAPPKSAARLPARRTPARAAARAREDPAR